MKRIWAFCVLLFLMAGLIAAAIAPAAVAQEPAGQPPLPQASTGTAEASAGAAEAGGAEPESLSDSFVVFDPSAGGDSCYVTGAPQTFCFRAESFTPDWEYVYNVWEKFPSDWTVNNVYVQGTPSCTGGGSWGAFSWAFQTAPYEVNITHSRYHAVSDHCTAYYCFEVISGGPGAPDPALESWYWDGDGYGSAPHNPCSDDNYTPSGQPACDQWRGPQASIPPCPPLMMPAFQSYEGCACEQQEHWITAANTGAVPVNLVITYTVQGLGTGGGPPTLGPIPPGGVQPFPVNLRLSACSLPSDVITMTIEALALETGITATATIVKHNAGESNWVWWYPENVTLGTLPDDWWGMGDGIENYGGPSMYWWLTGGFYNGFISAQTWYWDWSTSAWVDGGTMPNAVYRTEGDVQNNDMYNVGGSTSGFTPQNYNTQHQDGGPWVARATAPSVSIDDVIEVWPALYGGNDHSYLVGGYGLTPDGAYEYDPVLNTWTTRATNPFTPTDYPVDGCFGWADEARTDPVIIQFPDTTSAQTNLLVYHIVGDNWEEWTVPAGFPANGIWAHDVAMDYERNLCYITGGASTPGGGNLTSFYIYHPASNTVQRGPDFTTPRDFHASWYYDDVLCIAGGADAGGAGLTSTQCAARVHCPPCNLTLDSAKTAPPTARHDEVISYTIVLTPTRFEKGMFAVDPIPPGVEFAGNLTWDVGYAWYDPVDDAVYWRPEPPAPPKGTAAPAPPPATGPLPADALDVASGPEPLGPAPFGPGTPVEIHPEAVLWDNGPMVTHPGGGAGGADASALQTALGMNTYGFGHQFSLGYRMADDFEITDPLGWQIDTITFFAYQTDSPTSPSPITGTYFQIWDGPPWTAGSSIVWGDLVTNRLLNSTWANIYRVLDTNLLATSRPIFANTAAVGTHLNPGTYWLDWMSDGSLASGPWVPPITILGQTTTGDAYEYTTAWNPAMDSGTNTQQGMPFIIEGEVIPPTVQITFEVTVTSICGHLIWNEGALVCGMYGDPFGAGTAVLGEADIAADPMALSAAVCPDEMAEEPLVICNNGDCPLGWSILELSPTFRLAGMPIEAVEIATKGPAPKGLTVSSPRGGTFAATPLVNPDAVLWDQPLSVSNTAAYVDQVFPDFPNYSSFLADDFVNDGWWVIDTIFVPGDLWSGATDLHNATALTWQIYADSPISPGIPAGDPSGGGDPPVWTLTLPPHDPHVVITTGTPGGYLSNTTLNLPGPIILPPGTWWLVFYPTADFSTFGQYGRQPSDTTNGYTGQFINPGGGFGLGTAWQDWTVIGPAQQDIAFRLEGSALPITGDIPWLSEDPITGTVWFGECQPVTVGFDATGMLPGKYYADLLIVSSDPDTPTMTVRVTMTVPQPVELVDVTYTVTDAEVAFDATATGSPPILYAWDFDDGSGSTAEDPVHTYAATGCYTVTLGVENACGTDSWMEVICVRRPYHIYLPLVFKDHSPP